MSSPSSGNSTTWKRGIRRLAVAAVIIAAMIGIWNYTSTQWIREGFPRFSVKSHDRVFVEGFIDSSPNIGGYLYLTSRDVPQFTVFVQYAAGLGIEDSIAHNGVFSKDSKLTVRQQVALQKRFVLDHPGAEVQFGQDSGPFVRDGKPKFAREFIPERYRDVRPESIYIFSESGSPPHFYALDPASGTWRELPGFRD